MRNFKLETLYASDGVFIRYNYGCYSPGLALGAMRYLIDMFI